MKEKRQTKGHFNETEEDTKRNMERVGEKKEKERKDMLDNRLISLVMKILIKSWKGYNCTFMPFKNIFV